MSLKELVVVLQKIDRKPGYLHVVDTIERAIIEGQLSVGDILPIEAELAIQLGVNRSTLREGLRALENAGLIRRAGAKRLVVSIPSNQLLVKAMSQALSLGRATVSELWELQTVIEPLAAKLAAKRISPQLGEALQENLAETERQLEDDEAIIRLDVEFHQLISEATANRALILSTKPIGILLLPATRQLYQRSPQARHRLIEAHRKVLAAVLAGDDDAAELWMAKHIRDFQRGYEVAKLDPNVPVEISWTSDQA
jgi:DNA-binding FadR family transcriptional regulator